MNHFIKLIKIIALGLSLLSASPLWANWLAGDSNYVPGSWSRCWEFPAPGGCCGDGIIDTSDWAHEQCDNARVISSTADYDVTHDYNGRADSACDSYCRLAPLTRPFFDLPAHKICESLIPTGTCVLESCPEAVQACAADIAQKFWNLVQSNTNCVPFHPKFPKSVIAKCDQAAYQSFKSTVCGCDSIVKPDLRFDCMQRCPQAYADKNSLLVACVGCTSDTQCPRGQVCQGGKCVTPSPECDPLHPCAKGHVCPDARCPPTGCTSDTDCPSGQICIEKNGTCVTPSPNCGNGTVEGTEQCDNGPANSNTASDACRTDCKNHSCGDGVKDTGETCDEGPSNGSPNHCNATCSGTTPPVCGNNVVETGETCDDGNTTAGDNCSAACQTEPPPPPECTKNSDCTDGKICLAEKCVPCSFDVQCNDPNLICEGGKCVSKPPIKAEGCNMDADCPSGQICEGGKCILPPEPEPGCKSDAECGEEKVCKDGECVALPRRGCTSNADCGEGETCSDGVCIKPAPQITQPEAQPVAMGGGGCGCRMSGSEMEPEGVGILFALFVLGMIPLVLGKMRRFL